MKKGKVFISSTIYDFKDLRSAIKYWLSELGYEVYMSEYSDFPRNAEDNSYKTCLSTIEQCDWFILLIGDRVGGKIHDDISGQTISITRKEYRTAYNLFIKGKIKKVISFIRKDVWTAKQERNSLCKATGNEDLANIPSKHADDPSEIFSFIDEVRRIDDMADANKGKTEYPKNNWINLFNNFTEIVDTLKIELNLYNNISTLIWNANITEEIKQNLKNLVVKNSFGTFELFSTITAIRDKCIQQLRGNGKSHVMLSYNDCDVICGTFIVNIILKSHILKESLLEGHFLEYNATTNKYETNCLYKKVSLLIDLIEKNNESHQFFMDAYVYIAKEHDNHKYNKDEIIRIEYTKIAPILIKHDQLSNILNLSIYVLKSINSDCCFDTPQLYPIRLYDNFNTMPDDKKELFNSYDEFYGKEISDKEVENLLEYLSKDNDGLGDKNET